MIKNPLFPLYKKGKEKLIRELGNDRRESLGLDIGTRFIKLVAIAGSSEEPRLKWAGLREIPAPREEDVIADLVASLWKEGGKGNFKTKEVVINLGLSPTVQRLEFPSALSDEEIKEAALLEVSQLIPGLEDMESDMKLFRAAGAEKTGVLFIAAPATTVSQRVGLVEKAGLFPAGMDIDSLALLNSARQLGEMGEEGALLLLNMGTSWTNLAITKKGGLPFLRDIPQGSKELLPVGDSPAPVRGIEVLTQVERSLEYYQTRDKVERVERILLTGGATKIPQVYEYFSENMHILPEKWNPLLRITTNGEAAQGLKQFVEKEGEHFAVALGLALRSEIA